jgi:hypothetical protein
MKPVYETYGKLCICIQSVFLDMYCLYLDDFVIRLLYCTRIWEGFRPLAPIRALSWIRWGTLTQTPLLFTRPP